MTEERLRELEEKATHAIAYDAPLGLLGEACREIRRLQELERRGNPRGEVVSEGDVVTPCNRVYGLLIR